MSSVEPLDPSFPLTRQMDVDAAFMKRQPDLP